MGRKRKYFLLPCHDTGNGSRDSKSKKTQARISRIQPQLPASPDPDLSNLLFFSFFRDTGV
jgi:hypothetical protein